MEVTFTCEGQRLTDLHCSGDQAFHQGHGVAKITAQEGVWVGGGSLPGAGWGTASLQPPSAHRRGPAPPGLTFSDHAHTEATRGRRAERSLEGVVSDPEFNKCLSAVEW